MKIILVENDEKWILMKYSENKMKEVYEEKWKIKMDKEYFEDLNKMNNKNRGGEGKRFGSEVDELTV